MQLARHDMVGSDCLTFPLPVLGRADEVIGMKRRL
jgi:hypothetical protein